MMEGQLSLSLVEIIVLMAGAIMLGITIHFFIVSKRSINADSPIRKQKIGKELEEWKLRYLNDIEWRDKELGELRKKLEQEKESGQIFEIEAEELRKENKKLAAALEQAEPVAIGESHGYLDPLLEAQASLREYNQKVNHLIEQIDIVKGAEEKHKRVEQDNALLLQQMEELRQQLHQKEKEMTSVHQKQELTLEMSSILDSAYSEFNVLKEKMHKLENQVTLSKKINLEFEELKEENCKVFRDLEEQKRKTQAATEDKRMLEGLLAETEDKLRESNFQRQQLQKRVAYLEELSHDMQAVTEANKKLESQIKRIGELESMLSLMAEERDGMARKQSGAT